MLMYRSNPSTGEVYETKEVEDNTEAREDALRRGWFETPRWQRNPRPNGLSNDNIYEKRNEYVAQEFPRTLYKAGFKSLKVTDEIDKAAALADGWNLGPVGETLMKDGATVDVFTADAKAVALAAGWKTTTFAKEKK